MYVAVCLLIVQNAIFLELESKGVNPVHFQSHDIIIVVIIIIITMIIVIIIKGYLLPIEVVHYYATNRTSTNNPQGFSTLFCHLPIKTN